jgi:hypothetical protein
MRIRPDRFAVHKLDLPINCDAALSAARDWSAPSPVASLQFLFCSAC